MNNNIKTYPKHPKTGKIFTIPETASWFKTKLHPAGGGYTERKNMEFGKSLLSKDMVLYDIGANIGEMSIHWSPYVNRIEAFEPIPLTFECLRLNIKLNLCDNIKAYCAGVGAVTETQWMKFNPKYPEIATMHYSRIGNGKMQRIKMWALDDYRHDKVDYIKLDIEGHELHALKGMKKTINETKPKVIQCELHDGNLRRAKTNKKEVLDLLNSYGYNKLYNNQGNKYNEEKDVWLIQ